MNRDALVARIKLNLGFISGTAFDADIVTSLQQVQEELEREPELPWFLKKAFTGLATVADTKTVAVPNDFIRLFTSDQMFMRNSENEETPVLQDEEGFLRIRYPISEDTGTPQGFAIVNGQFRFYPTPDAVYTIQGTYFAKDAVLSSGATTNLWSTHLEEVLIGKAGFILASGKRDKIAMELFAGILGRGMQKLNEMNTADEAAGSKPVMGGED